MASVLDYKTAVEVLKKECKPDGLDVNQLLDAEKNGGLTYDPLVNPHTVSNLTFHQLQ